MKTIALKIPEELLEASQRCASSLHVPRAEYIRTAIDRMNRRTLRQMRARRMAEVSRRVRAESMAVNEEFSLFESAPDA
ncbi:MAG: hypothetical protein HY822_06685 [Acidobacteria bacterium]|nr:hypothetical protein [Acidobacteriota bacterium]